MRSKKCHKVSFYLVHYSSSFPSFEVRGSLKGLEIQAAQKMGLLQSSFFFSRLSFRLLAKIDFSSSFFTTAVYCSVLVLKYVNEHVSPIYTSDYHFLQGE